MQSELNAVKSDSRILMPLTDKVMELSRRPQEAEKKARWAAHQSLETTDRSPVYVYCEGIPAKTWDGIIGAETACSTPLGRTLERELRRRIWAAENIPDDRIVWPTVILSAPVKIARDWGVPLEWHQSEDDLGAKGYDPPFSEGIDMSRLQTVEMETDEAAARELQEMACTLLGGDMKVYLQHHTLSYSIFDTAVQMRGMDSICLDTIDCPDKVHALLEHITQTVLRHQLKRQERGWTNFFPDPEDDYAQVGFRVNCVAKPADMEDRKPCLFDEWAYISAQTSACLGPGQYAEFVQPCNARLAELFSRKTVYYHGCECLDRKMDIIAELPNLRRFHVSPWSSVSLAADKFRDRNVILEVHSHPGKVFFAQTGGEIKADLAELVRQAEGMPFDLNLSDIHNINNDPSKLGLWAGIATEAVCAIR